MNNIKTWKMLRAQGERLGRAELSKRAIALIEDFDGSYRGAMILAGRMKAIAQAAGYDDYWSEKVNHGFIEEQYALERLPGPATPPNNWGDEIERIGRAEVEKISTDTGVRK